MKGGVFTGFGFGAIQGGLFAYEAFRSGNFDRIVVAEIRPEVVQAVRQAGGSYRVNVATRTGLEVHEVSGVEIFNPRDPADHASLVEAIAQSTELCTALPSVEFYGGIVQILAEGRRGQAQPCVLYAAENHNHAAALLKKAMLQHLPAWPQNLQLLDTVIGKMSGVVKELNGLAPVADGLSEALLVEEFNRILISQVKVPGFERGLSVFEEKPDLLPFEEAKLYGHNATHALLGYLANRKGYPVISQVDSELLALAREAFLEESGPAMIARHGGLDPLFTPEGYRAYADDLLERMVNPWLRDAVARVIRDPHRKLGWHDRLIGTMRLALDAGVTPHRFAQGAAAAWELVARQGATLEGLWPEADTPPGRKEQLKTLIHSAPQS